jgi:transposase
MSWERISQKFEVPKSSCRKLVHHADCPRPPSHKPNLKIKGNVKKRLVLAIGELQKQNTRITSSSIMERAHVKVCSRTVQRFLKQDGYRYANTKKEIALTTAHKATRREICRKWLMEGVTSQNIIFTDETRFSLDGPDHNMSWQKSGCRRKGPRRQQGGGGMLIWGMLLPSGELHHTEVKGAINSVKYKHLLQHFALPTLESVLDENWLWQQDNAPGHVSEATLQFLEEKGVRLLGWPSKSPDLNVIENVWHLLDNHIYRDGASGNLQNLRAKVNAAVADFNQHPTQGRHIYESFKRRIFECYESGGELVKA